VDSTVSHVLVSTEGRERLAVRTLKYLQAVASGLLVVSEQWVLECLRDSSALGRALDWEVRDEELEGEEGPRRAREGRQGQEAALLQGFEVLVAGDLEGLARGAVEDLLARVGARAVTDLGSFSFSGGVTRLSLVDSQEAMEGREREVLQLLRAYKVATVEKDWLLDTICSHQVRPIAGRSRRQG
jgi:hypothetical protein